MTRTPSTNETGRQKEEKREAEALAEQAGAAEKERALAIKEEERRRHIRVFGKIPGFIIQESGRNLWVTIADISIGGIRLFMPTPLEPGQQVSLRVPPRHQKRRLEAKRPPDIIISANIVWKSKVPDSRFYEMGLRFCRIAPESREKVVSFLMEEYGIQLNEIEEKRKFVRISAEISADIFSKTGPVGSAFIDDISTSGMKLISQKEFDENIELGFNFELKPVSPIKIRGTVIRSSKLGENGPFEVGITFRDVGTEDKEMLVSGISYLISERVEKANP